MTEEPSSHWLRSRTPNLLPLTTQLKYVGVARPPGCPELAETAPARLGQPEGLCPESVTLGHVHARQGHAEAAPPSRTWAHAAG